MHSAAIGFFVSLLVSQAYAASESGHLETIKAPSDSPAFEAEDEPATSINRNPIITVSTSDIKLLGCNTNQQKLIEGAAITANVLVANAMTYLAELRPDIPQPRYTTWYGTYNKESYGTVVSLFAKMQNQATSLTYDCKTCPKGFGPSKDLKNQAYVYTSAYSGGKYNKKINFCGGFWKAPITGIDSQAGKIIQELSRISEMGGTRDRVRGKESAKALAARAPESAVMNTDSYVYFAENTPALS
ncbi:unnamed protein product [Rhizoctonia solani]|uniref:Lysine-specific metallo-endopeptidase domain-containing protein n=1 Tax=Rhizoctonia solani TaxID=456999 RepID=A0A8H3D800_9AGAM|nr:unnamed protein product [Rhizoctonia solani]